MGTEAGVNTFRTSRSAAAIYLVFVTEPVLDWLSVMTQQPTETHLSGGRNGENPNWAGLRCSVASIDASQ
jgi:hypothetical protein